MTKEDFLIKNLGTIAKSRTSAFVEKMQTTGDLNLIGQFGIGFCSVYIVADDVEVVSKQNEDKQYVWVSKADGTFAVSEDTWNEPLGRGTEISNFSNTKRNPLGGSKLWLLDIHHSYFPAYVKYVFMGMERTIMAGATLSATLPVNNCNAVPQLEPIWLWNPKEVTDQEYIKFYHSLAKDFSDGKPIAWSHFTAEGDVEFKAELFVPPKAPMIYEFDELLPKYLSILKGLVDSDTLPLNVSQEMLPQYSSLKTIKKKLIRKALYMIHIIMMRTLTNLLTRTRKCHIAQTPYLGVSKLLTLKPAEVIELSNTFSLSCLHFLVIHCRYYVLPMLPSVIYLATDIEESSDSDEKKGQYTKFCAKSDGKLTSPDQYISRLEPGQKDIFYITGTSKEQLERKVIFFTDLVDEYLMQYQMDYEDKRFQNVSKEGLKLGKDSKDKELKESLKELTKRWKGALASENMDDMKISNRLADKDIKAYMKGKRIFGCSGFFLSGKSSVSSAEVRKDFEQDDDKKKGLIEVVTYDSKDENMEDPRLTYPDFCSDFLLWLC
ncbi:hypothetical protein RHSIM_Rhsim06G0020200 [Rhododendron simsii]|uniref:Heat shock protein 90 n=1 Tax=Rhododendron simsii TaxID=118357 RepID=A0A834LML4_RHOSS|nr:hypothetical protein RHSIM_Rhsim06G0020200 [Rhododendron simsii]